MTHKPVHSNRILVEGTLFKVAIPHRHRKVQTGRAPVKSVENYYQYS